MELLKELMVIAESSTKKKKPIKKAAKAVYHRDYEKTKNKKYRKYDPATHVEEGIMDYIKGAGKQFSNDMADKLEQTGAKIIDPLRKMHAAGQEQSKQGEIKKAQKIEDQKQTQIVQMVDNIFRLLGKRTELKKSISQLSSPQTESVDVSEGMWDYISGAAGSAGKQVGGAARSIGSAVKQVGSNAVAGAKNIHRQGQVSSQSADMEKLTQVISAQINRLAQVLKPMGPDVVNKVFKLMDAKYARTNIGSVQFVKRKITEILKAQAQ